MAEQTRWTVRITKNTDMAVRSYLAERGNKRGDLSKLIERAVQREMLRDTIRSIQHRNASRPAEEMQPLIDQAFAETRAEFWRDKEW